MSNQQGSANPGEKLFDISEPILASAQIFSGGAGAFSEDGDAAASRILQFCGVTAFNNVVPEALPLDGHVSQYMTTNDRGPGALEAPLARRLQKDIDPTEWFRINSPFNPPSAGFPCTPPERFASSSAWTLRWVKCLGLPKGEREESVRVFMKEFVNEAMIMAAYIVRKTALADLNGADGSVLAGGQYSAQSEFVLHPPKCKLTESVTSSPPGFDATTETSPRGMYYSYNGIQYEVLNHRTRLKLVRSHEACMKIGGHRLRGYNAIGRSKVAFLNQPPAVLLEYFGYRVWAQGVAPVRQGTSIGYGSLACGGEAKNDNYSRADEQATAAMQQVAVALNLKGHHCGTGPTTRQFLYTNGDLRVYRAMDNRLYIVSGQERLIPPMTTNNKVYLNGYLYRMLRPEVVLHSRKNKSAKLPLSSDAFSPFGLVRCDEHDRDVALITEVSRQHILNDGITKILSMIKRSKNVATAMTIVEKEGGLSALLHRFGLNVRLMGEMSTRLSQRYFKLRSKQVTSDSPDMLEPISILITLLRLELVARALKHLVRRLLRNRSLRMVLQLLVGSLRPQRLRAVKAKDPETSGPDATTASSPKRTRVVVVEAPGDDGSGEGVGDSDEDEKADNAEDDDGASFLEEDFSSCFERSVWPVIEALYGSSEGAAIVKFGQSQFNINAQVDYENVAGLTYIMQHVMSKTGIRFRYSTQKWKKEGGVQRADTSLTAAEVAAHLVSNRSNDSPEGIAVMEPKPVVSIPLLPAVVYPKGEDLHLVGVARASVRTTGLAWHLKYLRPTVEANQSILALNDLCAIYCLDMGLVNDQDVLRWTRLRHDQVTRLQLERKLDHEKVALLDTTMLSSCVEPQGAAEVGTETPNAPAGQRQATVSDVSSSGTALGNKLDEFLIRDGVVLFPSGGISYNNFSIVELDIRDAVLIPKFGFRHRDVLHVTRGVNAGSMVIVVGTCNGFLYVAKTLDQPFALENHHFSARHSSPTPTQQALGAPSSAGATGATPLSPPLPTAAGQPEFESTRSQLSKHKYNVFALMGHDAREVDEECGPVLTKRLGHLNYYEPQDLGYDLGRITFNKKQKTDTDFSSESDDDAEVIAERNKKRLHGLPRKIISCFFFSDTWEIVEYMTDAGQLDTYFPGIQSGHRIIIESVGSSFRVIGVRSQKLWICEERIDALPRPLLPEEKRYVRILHRLKPITYDEGELEFGGLKLQRSMVSLNKYIMYFGQKVLFRAGRLAGVVGIILGSYLDTLYFLNVQSRTVWDVPGSSHEEVFRTLKPLLIGCALDLEVFEKTRQHVFECRTTAGAFVQLDHRADALLRRFGVVQGSQVVVLMGPFATLKCTVLGTVFDHLWTTLRTDVSLDGHNAIPLKKGEFRSLPDAAVSVRKAANLRLQLDGAPSDACDADHVLEPFVYLSATGTPLVFDSHPDVCGVFGLFHNQRITVAKDIFDAWIDMTVVGVFQGELWAVPDDRAAAAPLDGYNSTELLQAYSIIDVRGHRVLSPFSDYLHVEGFEITPSTNLSKTNKEHFLVHILQASNEIIGLDRTPQSLFRETKRKDLVCGAKGTIVLSERQFRSANGLWRSLVELEHWTIIGVSEDQVYGIRENDVGCTPMTSDTIERIHVETVVPVMPMSLEQIHRLQYDLHTANRRQQMMLTPDETRRRKLEDALKSPNQQLPYPPPNMPAVSLDELSPMLANLSRGAESSFQERLLQAGIPDVKLRLVLHWMLQWFGLRLDFSDSKQQGIRRLAGIEQFILKRHLSIPSALDYDAYRVQCVKRREQTEAQWNIPPDKLAQIKREAFSSTLAGTVDCLRAHRTLRLLPTVDESVTQQLSVPPAASLTFTEAQMRTARGLSLDGMAPPEKKINPLSRFKQAVAKVSAKAEENSLAHVVKTLTNASSVEAAVKTIIADAKKAGLDQVRKLRESQMVALHQQFSAAGKKKSEITLHRYKTSDGNVLFLDSSEQAVEAFNMRRGEVYRYTDDTDLAGIHITILGVVAGRLWRYEDKLDSQDRVSDEQARPFHGSTEYEIRRNHSLVFVTTKVPRDCDPFYFPRLDGPLSRFDIEEAACGPFGTYHGQRFVAHKPPPNIESFPGRLHGPLVTAIGVWGQNMYFATDYGGAFCIQCNDPIEEMKLEPLYSTVVGVFASERKNWFRAPVEQIRRGKKYVISVCFETTVELLQMWHSDLRHGQLVKWISLERRAPQVAAAGSKKGAAEMRSPKEKKQPIDLCEVELEAVIIGIRGGVLYCAMLEEPVARPVTPEELRLMRPATAAELEEVLTFKVAKGSVVHRTKAEVVAKKLESLSEYVDSSGSESGLQLRPPALFKCFNAFRQVCQFDTSDAVLKPFGVSAFAWVKMTIAEEVVDAVVIGVRGGHLWKLDLGDVGALGHDLKLLPTAISRRASEEGEQDEPPHMQLIAPEKPVVPTDEIPVATVFNRCECFADLVKHYKLVVVGTASLKSFTG
jgi:hypothetical protein